MASPAIRAVRDDEIGACVSLLHDAFADVAAELQMSEPQVIDQLGRLLGSGVLTRFGPLYHIERAGGQFILAALQVPDERYAEVTQQVNALPEVVLDGKTRLAVPPNDAAAPADALQRLADDAPLASRLAHNGKNLAAEMFDPARNNRRLAEVFIKHYTIWKQKCAA